jgi:hypothetical protein
VIRNTDNSFTSEPPGLNCFSRLYIPKLDSLISACRDKPFGIFGPGYTEDTSFVLSLTNLMSRLSSFAIIKLNPAVCTNTN